MNLLWLGRCLNTIRTPEQSRHEDLLDSLTSVPPRASGAVGREQKTDDRHHCLYSDEARSVSSSIRRPSKEHYTERLGSRYYCAERDHRG